MAYAPIGENSSSKLSDDVKVGIGIDDDDDGEGTDYYPELAKGQYKENNNKNKYIILGVSYVLWAILYKASLVGGDLGWVKSHLFLIGSLLFSSFIFYSICLWVIGFLKIQKKKKLTLYIIVILSLIGFVLYDHGELFDFHGMYNFIVFCIFIVTIDTIALILYLWYSKLSRRNFFISFSSFILALTIILIISLKHYDNIWGNGFLNKKMENGEKLCKINTPILWFDLLPRGAQNFWTGSQSCSREEHFNALFDSSQDNKLVVLDCVGKATYMILPETRLNLTFQEKNDDVLRESVLSRMEKKVYTYTEPVSLPDVEAVYVTCGEQSKLVTRVAGRRVQPIIDEKNPQPLEKLNVLLIYIDAVSRRQFFRNLPNTVKKLEDIHRSGIMHLNQFFRYGVIGFNTNSNSLGLYAGGQIKKGYKGVPIWEEYRNRGYVAGASDDHCEDWDTTYNNRTEVSLDHELIAPFCLPEYHERTGNPHGNFKGAYSIRRRCITGQYVHNYVLNYTREFIDIYDGKNPWFFRSSYIEAHEGTGEVLSLMDDDLVKFFDSLSNETLNRTAILIMSDHGLHMGLSYLFSNQGKTEHKLPFFATLFPEQFLNKYPQLRDNLEQNEQKLISAFDIYTTLRDILDFDIEREPKEKTGVGIDISETKLRKRSLYNTNKFSHRLNAYFDEIEKFNNYNTINLFKRKNVPGPAEFNNTIIWGKSVLRSMDYRQCEQILIHSEDCVCH
ncbi:DUF229-domain-containing protein [Anaeromyces robustus]|jgi:hypothetical protein|uniref:DUF229-domain-containing protein n=1 Tax=Anaeromyces robustus TaxID=1754192 RepID=A0A1Y1WNP9_9FUNG|nr:DUF229-domain-containing protein [Anaeromyces robustus]|eukprot:ORX75170.1 DUF229-domain-containing protein [Anaeromyces robustus]